MALLRPGRTRRRPWTARLRAGRHRVPKPAPGAGQACRRCDARRRNQAGLPKPSPPTKPSPSNRNSRRRNVIPTGIACARRRRGPPSERLATRARARPRPGDGQRARLFGFPAPRSRARPAVRLPARPVRHGQRTGAPGLDVQPALLHPRRSTVPRCRCCTASSGAARPPWRRCARGAAMQVLGPLGEPFPAPVEGSTAVLLGGGVGLPPVLRLAGTLGRSARPRFLRRA